LVDTSAYFALIDTREAAHPIARAIATRLGAEGQLLVTTNFILAETHALLLTRLGRVPAARFLQSLDRGATTVVRVSAPDEDRARVIIYQYDDKDFSLTDATSFAVMERLRIATTFTFDRNFAQYGLIVLTADQR
jgi:predicted nucleic acid-binding protein